VISLNNIMSKDNIEVNVRELYEAMLKAVKLKGYDRLVRKQKCGQT